MAIWAVLVAGLLFDIPPPEEIQRALRSAFEDAGIQQEWPGQDPVADAGEGSDGRTEAPRRSRPRPPGAPPAFRSPPPRPESREGSEVGRVLLWVAAAGLVLFLVALWLRNRRPATTDPHLAPEDAGGRNLEAPPPGPVLDDADRLALEGRFAEAVHVLLLDAFARVGLAAPLDPSWTSREAVSNLRLPEIPRAACATLVGAVEVSRFGGRPVGEGDYRRARAARDQVVASTSGAPA